MFTDAIDIVSTVQYRMHRLYVRPNFWPVDLDSGGKVFLKSPEQKTTRPGFPTEAILISNDPSLFSLFSLETFQENYSFC